MTDRRNTLYRSLHQLLKGTTKCCQNSGMTKQWQNSNNSNNATTTKQQQQLQQYNNKATKQQQYNKATAIQQQSNSNTTTKQQQYNNKKKHQNSSKTNIRIIITGATEIYFQDDWFGTSAPLRHAEWQVQQILKQRTLNDRKPIADSLSWKSSITLKPMLFTLWFAVFEAVKEEWMQIISEEVGWTLVQ